MSGGQNDKQWQDAKQMFKKAFSGDVDNIACSGDKGIFYMHWRWSVMICVC